MNQQVEPYPIPRPARELLRHVLATTHDKIELPTRNVHPIRVIKVFSQLKHIGFRWECGCGARGHDHKNQSVEAHNALVHVERMHPLREHDRPPTGARDNAQNDIGVPYAFRDDTVTNDAQQHVSVDQGSPQHAPPNSSITINIRDRVEVLNPRDRWRLFTDDELALMSRGIWGFGYTKLEIEIENEIKRRTF